MTGVRRTCCELRHGRSCQSAVRPSVGAEPPRWASQAFSPRWAPSALEPHVGAAASQDGTPAPGVWLPAGPELQRGPRALPRSEARSWTRRPGLSPALLRARYSKNAHHPFW